MKKTTISHEITAIILAAGSGRRMASNITKQRISLLGDSVLKRSVRAFSLCEKISSVVVVCREDEIDWAREELISFSKVYAIVPGGKTRAESARLGFAEIPAEAEFVAIHDAARCLITEENISRVIDAAIKYDAATAGTFVTDTVKRIEADTISATIPREKLFIAHTPQIFKRCLYGAALEKSADDESITDDNMLVESLGIGIYPVDTGKNNIKITTPEDIAYAEYVIERRDLVDIRVGHGYDVHRLAEGRKLILGGVDISHEKGLLGHSDADVLVHAIMDALLGACGLGDIGRHFPDNDESYKDISSLFLLKRVRELISDEGFFVLNVDSTVVLQTPKIAGYIDQMIVNISEILGIERGRVNVKATTEELLGFTGSEQGICAHAVATVKKGVNNHPNEKA